MEFSHKSLCIFFSFFFALLCSSNAYTFFVGGRDGWTVHPSENYHQWSSRMRFIVNDTLHFRYNSGSDSVMEVNNGDYDKCNTSHPIATLTGGDSLFTLNRWGPFYFISGNKSNCDQGQKMIVVVLSPRKKSSPPSPIAAAPAPGSFSGAPTETPISSSPQPGTLISASPASSPGGSAASSPTGNPADVNSPAGKGSSSSTAAAKPAVLATLTMSLAFIVYSLGLLH